MKMKNLLNRLILTYLSLIIILNMDYMWDLILDQIEQEIWYNDL